MRADPRKNERWKVPDVEDRGFETHEKATGETPKGAPRPNYFILIREIIMPTLVNRLLSRTPFVGKAIMAIAALFGVGGVAATEIGGYTLTGDTYVDLAIIISVTIITLFTGKAQIEKDAQTP